MNIEEKCVQIERELFQLLGYAVSCIYDAGDGLYYPHIFNIALSDFNVVHDQVFEYSNKNRERHGSFCIPVLFTPEQTAESFPQFYDYSIKSGDSVSWSSLDCVTQFFPDSSYDDEFLLAA